MLRLRRSLVSLGAALGFLIPGFTCQVCSAAPNHYVYVFPPGSIDVYDLDGNFTLVKSVPFPLTKGQSPVYVRGAVASAATGMLYLSYGSDTSGGSMLKYDLVKDAIVWQQTYSFGVDSMSISPDGQKIYMPTGEGAYTQGMWEVIDANTGGVIGQIDSGGKGPHNTITSLSGSHVYMGPRYSNYLVLGDTSTLSVIRNIGPVQGAAGIRPFTIDAEEKYAYMTTSGHVGFEVSDISTGQNLFWVCPPGFCWTSGSFNTISGVAHGISLSPDEKEIYLIDLPYNHVHVFNVTGLPGSAPVDVADIPLKCTLPDEGWLQHSRDGRFVWVGDCGDVIDTSTRTIVANMPSLLNTRIFNEIDFLNGVPSFSPLSRNQGGYGSQPSNLTLSGTSLTFGNQTVGTLSSAQSVTLTNSGTSPISVTSISFSGSNAGDFSQTNTCGNSIVAGGNCSISVAFNPSASGTRTATVSIVDSDPSSPQSISLNGTGVVPTTTVTVSPASLTFASQTVGSTSAVQTVTVTNTGNAALVISSITQSGDFSQSDNCGTSVAVSGSCTISVQFSPTASGTRTGTLSIADNTSGTPQTVTLLGTGVGASAPAASLSPTSLTFPSQTVGSSSTPQTVTLTNTGNATLTITSIASSGDFPETNTCGGSLAAAAKCTVSVTFTPTATGTRTGMLSITDNASGTPQSVALTGAGVATTAPAVSLSPTSLTFTSQTVATSSTGQSVTLTNTGNATLTITSITVNGDFSETNTCGGSLATGGNCTVSVIFTPTATGTRTGTLTITDNASGSPQAATLSGTGAAPSTGNFSLAASTNSVSTTAGQSATFTLSVTPTGGFNQTVAFVCTGAPQAATCSVTPVSVTLNGSASSAATVTITTTARSMLMPLQLHGPITSAPTGMLATSRVLMLLVMVFFAVLTARSKTQKVRLVVALTVMLITLLGTAGCAGLVSNSSGNGKPGTPAGTSMLTLTATSGTGANTVSHSTAVSLTVN